MTNLINPALLDMVRKSCSEKSAFVPNPAMDPSQQMGGMPGADPSAVQDPSGGGAAPAASGGSDPETIRMLLRQELQALGIGQGAGGAGGGPGGQKMKLDVGVELHRLNVMVAHMCDAMGIQLPAADMVTTEDQAANPSGQGPAPGHQSSIAPIGPVQPAGPGLPAAGQQKTSQDSVIDSFISQGSAVDNKDSILPLANKAHATALFLSKLTPSAN